MNQLVESRRQSNGIFDNPESYKAGKEMAQALINADMVPQAYRGSSNAGNAMIALDIAQRLGAAPLMVMQNLHVIHGNPGWKAKFLIASFNMCGRFSAIRYEWKGERGSDDYGCRAVCTEKSTGIEIQGVWIDWHLVKAEGWDKRSGSKWQSMPEKMFMYRAAAWMIDTTAPEISMGIPTSDELEDHVIDIDPGTGEILSSRRSTIRKSSRISLDEIAGDGVKADDVEIVNKETGEITMSERQESYDPAVSVDQILSGIAESNTADDLDLCRDLAREYDQRTKDGRVIAAAIKQREIEIASLENIEKLD